MLFGTKTDISVKNVQANSIIGYYLNELYTIVILVPISVGLLTQETAFGSR